VRLCYPEKADAQTKPVVGQHKNPHVPLPRAFGNSENGFIKGKKKAPDTSGG